MSSVRLSTSLLFLVLLGGLGMATSVWQNGDPVEHTRFILFDRDVVARTIVVSDTPSASEKTAADLLARTLAHAAGTSIHRFPVRRASAVESSRRAIRLESPPKSPISSSNDASNRLDRTVGYRVGRSGVTIWSRQSEDLAAAASWFLEQTVGAQWFMPGSLGVEVAPQTRREIPLGEKEHTPSYHSRNFGGLPTPSERSWYAANRLLSIFEHSHTAAALIRPQDFALDPTMAPEVNGQRYLPSSTGDTAWQPDLTSPSTAAFVAAALRDQLSRDPAKLTAVFGQNDSWRWDQSAATLATVAPHQYFRGYPDYSNTLFAFLNNVAAKLAPEFPDRFLSTYAYQWTENVPRFPVHPMVLPYLTADRSQWFDPAFADNDRDLMQRWGKAGPRFFGIYDYYYGGPFLVPRPTLYAVSESIPAAHAAGARAFYAECYPNWGLDGPKLWLAAQLLWDPAQDSAQLLSEYYTHYWKEAAEPLREFFAVCDRQWLNQPKPGYWIKYYKDDHQRLLYPPEVRKELWAILDRASNAATSSIVRERLAMVRAAFSVSDLFCLHDEKREALSRLTLQSDASTDDLVLAIGEFSRARAELLARHAEVKREFPLALSAELIGDYLRTDPRPRAFHTLARRGVFPSTGDELRKGVFAGIAPTPAEFASEGIEILKDGSLATPRKRNAHPFTLLDWNEPGGPWLIKGEPFETRKIELRPGSHGGQILRMEGCNQEALLQWQRAEPGKLYRATVKVRGKVSPANMTFLLIMFADAGGKTTDMGHTDRLPLGEFTETTSLEILARAPASAMWVGVSIRALWQVNDDYAEFEDVSLKRLP